MSRKDNAARSTKSSSFADPKVFQASLVAPKTVEACLGHQGPRFANQLLGAVEADLGKPLHKMNGHELAVVMDAIEAVSQ